MDAADPGHAEPIDADYKDAEAGARPQRGVGLATALGLSVFAAAAGATLGALADRAEPLAQAMDAVAPDSLTHLRQAQRDNAKDLAAMERAVAQLSDNGGMTPETRARFEALVASVAAIEARLTAWEQGLRLLPDGPDAFDPLRRRLSALESIPANPQLLRNEELARLAVSLDQRMRTLEQLTAGALAYEAAAARVSPVALQTRVDAIQSELTQVGAKLDQAATADQLRVVMTDLARLQMELTAIGDEAMTAGQAARAAFAVGGAPDSIRAAGPFVGPYAALAAALPDDPNVKALEPIAARGAPSLVELFEDFERIDLEIVRAARREAVGGGPWGAVQAALADFIVIRRVGEDSSSDIVERVRDRLAVGDLPAAVREAEKLKGEARAVAADWLKDARTRLEIETRLAAIRAELARRG